MLDYRQRLWTAFDNNDIVKATLIIKHMQECGQIDCADERGITSLMYACGCIDTIFAELLLEAGASVDTEDTDNCTPLIHAIWYGSMHLTKVLIDKNSNINITHDTDTMYWTPLQYAMWRGHVNIARLLIEHGCDVNSKNKKGWTPIMYAIRYDQIEMVKMLIEQGADTGVKDSDGNTALDIAKEEQNKDIVYLLEKFMGVHI